MITDIMTGPLPSQIEDIFAQDPEQASARIEVLLKARLGDLPAEQARSAIEALIDGFASESADTAADVDKQMLSRIFTMILGDDYGHEELTPGQMLERLSQSLNTIFDALNRLISSINQTFSGGFADSEQTIRQFIGFHLEGGDHTQSLESYLGQIDTAFLTTQQALQRAVHTKVGLILQSIDPRTIDAQQEGGFKIGPLRKAQAYEMLKEKIEQLQHWFDSGRLMEDFLREFERNCQTLSRK